LKIALATVLAGSSMLTMAQGPPPLTDRPSGRELEKPELLPEQPPSEFELPPVVEPEPGASTEPRDIEVEGFVFEGNRAVPTEVLQRLAAPYAQRKVSRADLEQLRQALSRYYVDRGYINSGALLPADFYRDRLVHFRIVEGHVEDIRQQGLGRLRESYLRQRLLRSDEPLDVNLLQDRFQLLLTDPLFAKVNARLEPGAAPGSAILDVDVTRARPWDLTAYYNNYQPPSVGAEALGVSGVLRNLTGLGDALDATCQQGTDKGGRCSLGWQVPIVYRTDIHARYDYGDSSVLEEPVTSLDVKSLIVSYELGLSHAVVDTLRSRASLGLTYAHRENKTTLLGQPFSFVPGESTGTSKVDAWRFEQDFVHRWESQAFAARSTLTFGSTNTDPNAGPPDQVPAKNYFFWLGQVQFNRRVLENGASLFFRGTLQWTRDRLVPLEQIAVGGVGSVRGYRENQLVRDQGYYLNLEFHYPLFGRDGSRHRLYVVPFFDYGEAWNIGEDRQRLSSVGLGFNWQFERLFADFYYGRALIKPEVETSGNLQDEGIHFQVRYEF